MVIIRLARGGSKKRPFYHINVANSRDPLGGRYIERLGFFNPIARGKEEELRIDLDRLAYWQERGAQVSDTLQQLLKNNNSKPVEEATESEPEAVEAPAA